MGTTMNRDAYERIIKEDIEWLLRQPKGIIRDHIQAVLETSPDREFGPGMPPRRHWPVPASTASVAPLSTSNGSTVPSLPELKGSWPLPDPAGVGVREED